MTQLGLLEMGGMGPGAHGPGIAISITDVEEIPINGNYNL